MASRHPLTCWSGVISLIYCKNMGLAPYFILSIRCLYTGACALNITNNLASRTFELHRGTRQGCPLSAFLFILALEPLAIAIRENPDIIGVIIANKTHKILLYADDIIMLMSRPLQSVEKVLATIDNFSTFSGYKVNWS